MELSICHRVVLSRFLLIAASPRQMQSKMLCPRAGEQKWTLGMDILKDVKQIISKQVGVPLEQLSPESRLEAIGVESLDIIEIIFALEKKYDVAIPFNANESAALAFETIGQVAEAVSKLVAKPA
jgi:acyl carrier protein